LNEASRLLQIPLLDYVIIGQRSDDRADAVSYSDTNIRIHKLNVDFVPNWMTGFQRLVKRLQDDKVEKDNRFGTDAVSVWWRQHYGEEEGVSDTDCLTFSKW
jgi:hypothetical protein